MQEQFTQIFCSWPVPVVTGIVIVALVFLCKYADVVRDWLKRTESIGKDGLKMRPPEDQRMTQEKGPLKDVKESEEAERPVIQETIEQVRKQLEEAGIVENERKIKTLVKWAALSSLAFRFQRLSSMIYGTQVTILENLNSTPEGQTRNSLERFYHDVVCKLYPAVFLHHPFDKYMAFLVSQELIVAHDDRYKLTQYGQEFLRFLLETGQLKVHAC